MLLARLPDRPGSLAQLLALVGERGANLLDVEHIREGFDLHVRETRRPARAGDARAEHAAQVAAAVRDGRLRRAVAVR